MIRDFSPKQWDYINTLTGFKFEICEGTTFAGKSGSQQYKFGKAVARSKYPYHIMAGLTGGKVEAMIQDENGFLKMFPFAKYCGKGDKDIRLPHIKFGKKIIFICGYKTRDKWEFIRGMNNIGVSMIDEFNLCHEDFYKEMMIRSNDFCMASTNPDDPRKACFTDVINTCRPYEKYASDVPQEIMADLLKATPNPFRRYWFFSFRDNPAATPEIIEAKRQQAVPGSKQYRNLILGLRGRATGLVFPNFTDKNLTKVADVKEGIRTGKIKPLKFTCGVDTAYSSKSKDTIAMLFMMITKDRKCYLLDEAIFNNRDLDNPLAPSDTVKNLLDFLEKNEEEWGRCENVFVDSADQATITELQKHKRRHKDCRYNFIGAYKKTKIIDRIKLMQSWIYTNDYIVCDHCKEHLFELSAYSWDESKIETPEDGNDHTVNASQYAWLPFKEYVGKV